MCSPKVRSARPCPRGPMLTLRIGYKQYDTGRTYMARMGDWRNNKDEELELDGIGGVNILVKADVHRSGTCFLQLFKISGLAGLTRPQESTSRATPSRTRPRRRALPRWRSGRATRLWACRTTSCGTSTPKRRAETYKPRPPTPTHRTIHMSDISPD